MTAERILQPVERLDGSGRQPASVEELRDAHMENRVLRLDLVTLANECRRAGRTLAYIGIRDDSPDAHQLGVDLEAKGNRALRQVGIG